MKIWARVGNRSAHLQDACGSNYDSRPTKISGTGGVTSQGNRTMSDGTTALIPKTTEIKPRQCITTDRAQPNVGLSYARPHILSDTTSR
jgi:hypothetical protein